MTIDQIREQIAISLGMHCDEKWFGILDDAEPGHYGVENLEFQLAIQDIWVVIQEKTFTFKDGTLSFSAQLGASNEQHGVVKKHSKNVSGSGTFDFEGARGVKVLEFKINEKIDLFEK